MNWLVFWSNDAQHHRILRKGDPPPVDPSYVQVGEFTDYAYAVEFVNQRMSVRRLTTTTEDDGFGQPSAHWRRCPRCDGSGKVATDAGDKEHCPACAGVGGWYETPKDQVIG